MRNVIYKTSSKALNPQKNFLQYGFPFTLNPTKGCFFGCKYCFSYLALRKTPSEFFQNIEIKENIAQLLDKELGKLQDLPQHLKRVQINEACDPYNPIVFSRMEKTDKNVMKEILEVFERHWNHGNKWMLHILTKSHVIVKHLEILERMKHMVQIEMSFAHIDEKEIRNLEMFTPSINKRLQTIRIFSDKDIFVRVMAMPFFGDTDDLTKLKETTFASGAKAFKHKELNYFDRSEVISTSYDELLQGNLCIRSGKNDFYNEDFIIRSGEEISKGQTLEILLPTVISKNNWAVPSKLNERLSLQKSPIVDMGYSMLNKENWNCII